MLTKEDNELICHIGPGTTMGEVVRLYWTPIAMSSEVAAPDSDPLRVRVFGENYVLFRDSNGELGLLDELCKHRGASLVLGRVEDCGIRCLYHGWKFAVDGTIQETPNHDDARFRERFKATAYPVRESAGLIWAYFGPQNQEPPFPHLPMMDVDDDHRVTSLVVYKANYVQVIEAVLDSSHLGILHQDALKKRQGRADQSTQNYMADFTCPTFEAERTDFGLHYVAFRGDGTLEGNRRHARVAAYAAPFMVHLAGDHSTIFNVPGDDGTTYHFDVFYNRERPIGLEPLEHLRPFNMIPEMLELYGASRATYNRPDRPSIENRFLQDRAAMRRGETFSGLPQFLAEDLAVEESMGPIYDRSKEVLVPADVAINLMRRTLVESAQRHLRGELPIGLGLLETTVIHGAEGILEPDQAWQNLVPEHKAIGRVAARTEPELASSLPV